MRQPGQKRHLRENMITQRKIEVMTPDATLLDIKDLTAYTERYWYWDADYKITPDMLSYIFDMYVGHFKNIKQASYQELQTWPEVCQRVDTTKFSYFKVSILKDKAWRYPFTRYQAQQKTGNGRTMFSIRHAVDVTKTCVHVFAEPHEVSWLQRLHTPDQLVDNIENTPYWQAKLASKGDDPLRTWRLVYTPDLGLYWVDCIFAECMEGDWFQKPSGHDQAVWDMTIEIVKSYDHFDHDNVLDVIDQLIAKGVPLITGWNPEDF